MSATERVRVELGARAYDVLIGADVLATAGAEIAAFAPNRRVFIVTDARVAGLHLDALLASIARADLVAQALILPPGEETKSFHHLEELCGALLSKGMDRRDLVIAFGGGVIGDLAGFAASILLRGVAFVQIPTTLLAQVDSSVGGKTAIDTPQGKNLVGAFHQPRLVVADLSVLRTLSPREMRAGYAEIVKYGLINDAAFFEWCEANGARVVAGDDDALREAVSYSVRAKAAIVAADEKESGARALLNLGHTFAHALETAVGHNDALLHGEAVGAGLSLAHRFAAQLGVASRQDFVRVDAHLRAIGIETDLRKLAGAPFDADALVDSMFLDKKAEAGALTFILTHGIGAAFVQKRVDADDVRGFLRGVLANAQ